MQLGRQVIPVQLDLRARKECKEYKEKKVQSAQQVPKARKALPVRQVRQDQLQVLGLKLFDIYQQALVLELARHSQLVGQACLMAKLQSQRLVQLFH